MHKLLGSRRSSAVLCTGELADFAGVSCTKHVVRTAQCTVAPTFMSSFTRNLDVFKSFCKLHCSVWVFSVLLSFSVKCAIFEGQLQACGS